MRRIRCVWRKRTYKLHHTVTLFHWNHCERLNVGFLEHQLLDATVLYIASPFNLKWGYNATFCQNVFILFKSLVNGYTISHRYIRMPLSPFCLSHLCTHTRPHPIAVELVYRCMCYINACCCLLLSVFQTFVSVFLVVVFYYYLILVIYIYIIGKLVIYYYQSMVCPDHKI